jgi:chromosome partitioning protein
VQKLLARPVQRRPDIGMVVMRAKEGTLSVEHLQQFLQTLKVPVLAQLRDTQNYVQLAARGLTLWDVAPSRVERDLQQWQSLQDWLNH